MDTTKTLSCHPVAHVNASASKWHKHWHYSQSSWKDAVLASALLMSSFLAISAFRVFFFIFSHLGAINFLIRIYERLVIFGPFSIYNCAWTFSFQQNLISGISCSEYEKSSLLFVLFLLLSFLYSVLSEWTLSCLFFILRKLHHLLNFISETFSFCNQHHSPNTFYSTVPIATCRCWLQSGWDNSGARKNTFTTNYTLRPMTNTCPNRFGAFPKAYTSFCWRF